MTTFTAITAVCVLSAAWGDASAVLQEKPAAEAPATVAEAPAPAAAPAVNTFTDDFNEAVLGYEWTAEGVTDKDISNSHVTLSHQHPEEGVEEKTPASQIIYQLADYQGDLSVEIKFDEFVRNENCRFEIILGAASGSTAVLGRWSTPSKQSLHFQALDDGKQKAYKELPYKNASGILKIRFAAKTGDLSAYYKETPEADYRLIEGCPVAVPGMKEGPYFLKLFTQNWTSGGPSSVKLDWVKITTDSPAAQ